MIKYSIIFMSFLGCVRVLPICALCIFATLQTAEEVRVLQHGMIKSVNNHTVVKLEDGYTGACHVLFDDSTQLRWKGYFIDGLADGISFNYYADGRVKTIISRKKGLLHGPYIFFDDKELISSVSYFIDGVRVDPGLTYEPSGKIKSELWVHGKKKGTK